MKKKILAILATILILMTIFSTLSVGSTSQPDIDNRISGINLPDLEFSELSAYYVSTSTRTCIVIKSVIENIGDTYYSDDEPIEYYVKFFADDSTTPFGSEKRPIIDKTPYALYNGEVDENYTIIDWFDEKPETITAKICDTNFPESNEGNNELVTEVINSAEELANMAITNEFCWSSPCTYSKEPVWVGCYVDAENIGMDLIVEEAFTITFEMYTVYSDGTEGEFFTKHSMGFNNPPYYVVGWSFGATRPCSEMPVGIKVIVTCTFDESSKADNIEIIPPDMKGVTINGKVTKNLGLPIFNAALYLMESSPYWWQPYLDLFAYTGSNGHYESSILPKEPLDESHTYKLKIVKEGCKSQTKTTEPVMTGKITTLNFELGCKGKSLPEDPAPVTMTREIIPKHNIISLFNDDQQNIAEKTGSTDSDSGSKFSFIQRVAESSTSELNNNLFSTILTRLFTSRTTTSSGSSLLNTFFSKLLNLR